MVLKPEEYLTHQGFVVSLFRFSLVKLPTFCSSFLQSDMVLLKYRWVTLLSQGGAALWCIGFVKVQNGVSILGGGITNYAYQFLFLN